MASTQHSADQPDSDRTLPADGNDETQATPRRANVKPQDASHTEPSDKAGDQVGIYKLISKLGEGGFGTVWLAERREPFVQQVALKIVKLGMDSKSVVARFEQERQALAVMNHAHVAKVLDGGLTPTGRPYFAMEYVKGEPITDYCDRQKLTIKQRLELFTQVCEAVQHAHTKGIIHRDLKPGNILVASAEGNIGQTKVIDFGVAKALTQRMTEHTIFTETGQMVGTPSYMSPEQAEPDANDIDTRSDVYSLGVILYELLSGALPFDQQELRKKAYREIQRIIREEDPPTPSARLSTIASKDDALASRIAESRGEIVSDLARALRAELEWIPLKAMRKSRAERYGSPIELAQDIGNFLAGQPLSAAPESNWYRTRKYVRRHARVFVAAAAVLFTLLAGIGLTSWQWLAAKEARTEALENAARADEQRRAAEAAHERTLVQTEKTEQERRGKLELLAVTATSSAMNSLERSDLRSAARSIEAVKAAGLGASFATRWVGARLSDTESDPVELDGLWWRGRVVVSSNRQLVASTSDPNRDPSIRIWDIETGRLIHTILGDRRNPPIAVAFQSAKPCITSGCNDGTICTWNLSDGQLAGRPIPVQTSAITALAAHPDGEIIATGGLDGSIRTCTLNPNGSSPITLFNAEQPINAIAYSRDGSTLCAASIGGPVRLWKLTQTPHEMRELRASAGPFAISHDGAYVYTGSPDGKVCIYESATGRLLRQFSEVALDLALHPDGQLLAVLHPDGSLRFWDTKRMVPLSDDLHTYPTELRSISFTSDGNQFLGFDHRHMLQWNLKTLVAFAKTRLPLTEAASALAFDPSGAFLATGNARGEVTVWDRATGAPLGLPLVTGVGKVLRLGVSRDGSSITALGGNGNLETWNWQTHSLITKRETHKGAEAAAIMAWSDTLVALAEEAGVVHVWKTSATTEGIKLNFDGGQLVCLAIDSHAKLLAGASGDQRVILWDLQKMVRIADLELAPGQSVQDIAFAPDGQKLALAGFRVTESMNPEGFIEVRDLVGKAPTVKMSADTSIDRIAYSPDGATIAATTVDETRSDRGGRLRLWNAITGLEIGAGIATCFPHAPLAFNHAGDALAASTADGTCLFMTQTYRGQVVSMRECLGAIDLMGERVRRIAQSKQSGRAGLASTQRTISEDATLNALERRAGLISLGQMARDDSASTPIDPARGNSVDEECGASQESSNPTPNRIRAEVDLRRWISALELISLASEPTLQRIPPHVLATVALETALLRSAESADVDVSKVHSCALRAAKSSNETDPMALKALALSQWIRGEKAAASATQQKLVKLLETIIKPESRPQAAADARSLTFHYFRPDHAYEGWSLWIWTPGADGRSFPLESSNQDSMTRIPVEKGVGTLGVILRKGNWQEKDTDRDLFITLKPEGTTEIWAIAGSASLVSPHSLEEARETLHTYQAATTEINQNPPTFRDSENRQPTP